MAITISIDNDRTAIGIQSLVEDESLGVQTPSTPDDGNDIQIALSAAINGALSGYTTVMNGILNGATIFGYAAFKLSDAQKVYCSTTESASSALDFVKVTATNGEQVDNLFFSDAAGNALNGDQVAGMQTLDGEDVFLWSNGDLAIATTSDIAGAGRIVAVFCLHEAANHLSAQIQMAVFEPLSHPDTTNPDDSLNFTDVLNVSAQGSISFDFDALKSGSSLWVAVGSSSAGLLVTGGDPDIDGAGKKTNASDVIHTSQGGIGATIGVNNQLFDNVGETGVFTLVTGFNNLVGADAGATGDYVVDPRPNDNKPEGIDYSGYINTTGAGIFISQSEGSPAQTKDFDINLFTAGGGTTPEESFGYVSGLVSDAPVDVATVTVVDNAGHTIGTWALSPSGGQFTNGSAHEGVTVSMSNNNIDVNGVFGEYVVSWTTDGVDTFNRFELVSEAGQFDVGRVDVNHVTGATQAVGRDLIVDDDGPAIGPISDGLVELATGATGTVSNSLNGAVGIDPKTTSYTLVDYADSVTINGIALHAVPNSATPANVTAVSYWDNTNGDAIFGNAGDTEYYRLTLSQTDNLGAGSYTFQVLHTPPAAFTQFDFSDLPSGQNLFGIVAANKANVVNNVLPDGGLLVTPNNTVLDSGGVFTTSNPKSGTINTSKGGGPVTIGNGNQMFDTPGEGAWFSYVDNQSSSATAGVGLNQGNADDADTIRFDGTNAVTKASVEIVQSQGTGGVGMHIAAYDVTFLSAVDTEAESRIYAINPTTTNEQNAASAVDTADQVNIIGVKILNSAGQVIEYRTNLQNGVTNGGTLAGGTDTAIAVQFTLNNPGGPGNADDIYSVNVTNLAANMTVQFETSAPHDVAVVENVQGKYDIGGFNLQQDLPTPDQLLEFTAKVTDGDGDSNLACWQIGIDGSGVNDNNAVAGLADDCTPVDGTLAATLTSSALQVSAFQELNHQHLLHADYMLL